MPYSVPEMNRLQQRKLRRQEPDSNPNARLLCKARTGSLLSYQAFRARFRKETSGRGTLGRGALGRGTLRKWTLGKGTSRRGPLGSPSSPADSRSSCCSTSTSEVFPAASASRRVGAAVRGICGVTSPKNSSPVRVLVSGVHGHAEALWFVSVGQAPEVVAVGYARATPALAQVARLHHRLP
jgi:hypothetical protein